MDEENQTMSPASLSAKRKRGRPRKDEVSRSESARNLSQVAGQTGQVGDVLVGQSVSGVLDGKFDAGYLLTVSVGNSGTVLTGIVFEPGRTAPISTVNDVAPHVEMLKRAEIPTPIVGPCSQPLTLKDAIPANHSKENSVQPSSEHLNSYPSIVSSINISEVQITQSPTPGNLIQVVHSNINLKSSFHETDGHVNLNKISGSLSSSSEPMEIQTTDTLNKHFVHLERTVQSSLADVAVKPSISEHIKIEVIDDKPVITDDRLVIVKELSNDPVIAPQVTVQSPEHGNGRNLDLFGDKAGSLQTEEPLADESSGKLADASMVNATLQEIEALKDHNTSIPALDLDSQLQLKDLCKKTESQAPDLNLRTFPSEPTPLQFDSGRASSSRDGTQPSHVTEVPEDVDPQSAVVTTGSNMA